MILICDNCERTFVRHRANVFPERHTFCNTSCRREFQLSGKTFDDVLDFLVKYILEHGGVSPTYREIADNCEVSSTSHVKYALDQLVEAGLIILPGNGRARGIQVVGMQLTYTDPRGRGEIEEEMSRFSKMIRQTSEFPGDTPVRIELLVVNGYALTTTLEELRELVSLSEAKGDPITDYCFENYLNDTHCSLCGNRGIIDTTGVRTPAGISVGRKNYCICPNGQTTRKLEEI